MELPHLKTIDRQLKLFDADRLLTSTGELRWAVGEFYENKTAEVSGASRMRTDSRCKICPDLYYAPRVFFETKGVGKTGHIILYKGRLKKYQDFFAAGNSIHHWIWSHRFRAMGAATYNDLYSGLAAATQKLLIVDFQFLVDLTTGRPEKLINNQYNKTVKKGGYNNNEQYGTGWTIPVKTIVELCFRVPGPIVTGGPFPVNGVEVFVSRNEFAGFLHDAVPTGK